MERTSLSSRATPSPPQAPVARGNAGTGGEDARAARSSGSAEPVRPPERQRLHESFQADRRYLERMVALREGTNSARVDAILELKGSVDASTARLKAQNAAMHRRAHELAERERREYSELLNKGKNPHEVARARAVQIAAELERQGIAQRIERKQAELLDRLEVERVADRRRDRLERERRAFEREYQAEMGRSAAEARTEAYLVARTGKAQLDPTGKLVRVYPSQETTLKDCSFGLGHNLVHDTAQRKTIVDKVRSKSVHDTATASSMLLPRQPPNSGIGGDSNNRDTASPPGVDLAALNGPTMPVPGRDLREINHKLVPAGSCDSLPPIHGGGSGGSGQQQQSTTSLKKGFGKPKLSVLEQQMLAKAREKQKETGVFQKQVVWGKEFTGDAFLADPPVLWFQDFDVGKPLALSFKLTNVSNTFNHFKLADMDEEIRELFEITYTKPGRMSAGMSCTLRMSFTAIAAVDLATFLPMVAQTGAFRIPVKCTCKKAVPVLLQREIEFRDVVAGEKKTISVTLENRGALPLHFSVVRHLGKEEHGETHNVSGASGPEVDDLTGVDNNIAPDYRVETDPAEISTASRSDSNGEKVDTHVDTSSGNPNDAAEDLGAGGSDTPSRDADSAIAGDAEQTLTPLPVNKYESQEQLSEEEQVILAHAKAKTMYKPEGFETPLHHTKSGVVAPYSSTQITFTFTPAASSAIENQAFSVTFAQEGGGNPRRSATARAMTSLAPSSIIVTTEASQVPVFTADRVLNLGCCVYDKLYRHQLVVCNRGKVALKIQVRTPKVLESCVEFAPSMGYVQAASVQSAASPTASSRPSSGASENSRASDESGAGRFVVQVKFRPHSGMWKRLERKGFGREALGFVAVPVQVVVPDQVVPVFFLLIARVTSGALLFSMDKIAFGSCALGHSVSQRLTIESTSRLPQHFGFLRLPQEVKVDDPGDGVGGTLLPFEKKSLTLVYQPNVATPFRGKLCVRTSLNQEYTLSCSGSCFAPPLVFSHSVVRLGATQLGQSQSFSLLCSNISEKVQSLELLPPPSSQSILRLTPLVSRIDPGASVRVEIEFAPTESIFETSGKSVQSDDASDVTATGDDADQDTSAVAEKTAKSQTSNVLVSMNSSKSTPVPGLQHVSANLRSQISLSEDSLWQRGLPSEARSIHHRWTILCFRRDEIVSQATSGNGASGSLFSAIQVETTVVDAQVYTTPARLDFNQVAIGQSLVIDLAVINSSADTDVVLSAKPLHILGGFRMINSLRPVRKSGGRHTIKMEFKPQNPIIYEDELELSSSTFGPVRIPLRGEGINPSLSFQPADGWLDFKDTLARNRSVLELVLVNASAFPLTYSIEEWPESKKLGTRAPEVFMANGLAAFTFSPGEAIIPAQGTLTVKVVFSPAMHQPAHYKQQFRVKVPNESEMHILTLSGRCWENQLYVFSPAHLDLKSVCPDRESTDATDAPLLSAPPPTEDPFDLPPNLNLGALLSANALLGVGLRKPQPTIVLTFDCDDASCVTTGDTAGSLVQHLMIGSTLPPSEDETYLQHAAPSGKSSAPTSASGSSSATGTFEIVLDESVVRAEHTKLFSLEPTKGTLNVGQQVPVQVTFKPHQQHQNQPSPPHASGSGSSGPDRDTAADTALRAKIRDELVVTQWVEVHAICTLRGGSLWRQLPSHSVAPPSTSAIQKPGSGASDADTQQTVHLTLRAKLNT